MALQLNQELQNKYPHLKISVLKMSEVKENKDFRIDDAFHTIKIFRNPNLEYKNIGNCLLNSQYGISINMNEDKIGVPIYRMNEIENMICKSEVSKYAEITNEEFNTFKLNDGDVLFNRTNSYEFVGRTGIFYKQDKDFVFASYLVRLVVDKKIILPEYLTVFLNTKIGQNEIKRRARQSINQTNVNPEEVKQIKIPLFPLSFQQEIEEMVKTSHACLEQSKDLYRQAEVLLYRELGLDPENPLASIETHSGSLNISVRPLSQSLNATGRLDSEYYQQKYDEIQRVIKSQKFAKLSDLVNMQKSIEPGSEAYQEKGIPFIRVSNFNKFGISDTDIFLDFAEFNQIVKPKKETILLSKDGSIGIAYCVKDDGDFITSSALLHLNIKREKQREILPKYLTLILNSILVKFQAERDSGGSIIAHWRISEIEQILIPILDISIQEKIENLIKQSFTLRQKANELLQQAKFKVETAIVQAA
ncbi:MAG: restriction endonuclease subunit S [Neisseriaceae bacterium]|nr:restriction endonuclease subunit S [Neisseriaceae bacterium]